MIFKLKQQSCGVLIVPHIVKCGGILDEVKNDLIKEGFDCYQGLHDGTLFVRMEEPYNIYQLDSYLRSCGHFISPPSQLDIL